METTKNITAVDIANTEHSHGAQALLPAADANVVGQRPIC